MSLPAKMYSEIGRGRKNPGYIQTVCSKGRMDGTIEYVVIKKVDMRRYSEVERDIKIRHKLRHNKIVQFIQWFQTETFLCLLLEYCPEGTLLELLERDFSLPELVIKVFAYDVIDALLFVHNNGVILNDLAPRNILLDECGVLKLNNFSSAVKITDLDMTDFDVDFEYLAPELLNGSGVPSFASDMYSLGCLLYRMATGAPPFTSSSPDEMCKIVQESSPAPVSNMSNDFNDLVMKLLKKDPYDRPTWAQLIKHPFWKDIPGQNCGVPVDTFSVTSLPKQEEFESRRQGSARLSDSLSLTKSLKISNLLQNAVLEEAFKAESDVDLIIDSPLLGQAPLIANNSIEKEVLPSCEGMSIPLSPAMLRSNDRDEVARAVNKLVTVISSPDRPTTKIPLISWTIRQAKTPQVAEILANSELLGAIIDCAVDATLPNFISLCLTLFGTLFSSAPNVLERWLKPETLKGLEQFCNNPHQIISRKAIACVGELVSFLARTPACEISCPEFASTALVNGLKSSDEVIRHLAIRSIANIADNGVFSDDFDSEQVEQALAKCDYKAGPAMIENFGVCVANLYKSTKPSSSDFPISLCRALIKEESENANILALIIASETETLASIKDGIVECFKSATGELRSKAALALSIVFKDSPMEFIDIAQKFFQTVEKLQAESPQIYEILLQWTTDYCEKIVDTVGNGENMDLLQIVYQAMQIRQLAVTLWSSKFEKKIQKIVRNTTFNTAKSEVALQIIQCALCYQTCNISIVTDLCRALNSQLGNVRFAVVKLIADATTQKPIHQSVISFIESNILTQCQSLLQDEIVIDKTLRILSNAVSEKPSIVSSLTKATTLSLIIAHVSDNTAALELITKIIETDTVPFDTLISAKLIPAILKAMENKEHQENALDLLLVTLETIEKHLGLCKTVAAKRNFIKSVHTLATMASKTAMIMLVYPKATPCLCLLIKLFTPQGNQSEVIIDSAFQPFCMSLSQGCRKPEHSANLARVLNVLQWAAENSSAMKLRLKRSRTVADALKKAVDNGNNELKAAAIACQRAIH